MSAKVVSAWIGVHPGIPASQGCPSGGVCLDGVSAQGGGVCMRDVCIRGVCLGNVCLGVSA